MSKTIGVIGGLGPEATLDFFAKMLKKTPAKKDQDHIHLIINNNPKVPNRNEALAGKGPSPAPALIESAKALEAAGADALVMVCNTAHAFATDILKHCNLPFIDLIEVTVEATLARYQHVKHVGILASSGCLDAQLYQDAFSKKGVKTLELTGKERESFMALLYKIKARDKDKQAMKACAQSLIEQGAEVIVAACTEVPLVLEEKDLEVGLISSTDCLVERTLSYAL